MGTTVLYHDRLAFCCWYRKENTVGALSWLKRKDSRPTGSLRLQCLPLRECSTLWLDGFQIAEISDLYPRVLSQFNKILLRVLFTAVPCVLCHNCQVVGTGPNKTSHRWRTKMGLTAIFFKQSNQTHTIFCDTVCNARVTQTEKNKHCVRFISSPKV